MQSGLPPLLLLGCGKMGGALFTAWQQRGLAPSVVVDRHRDETCGAHKIVRTLSDVPASFRPAAIILAVKPQKAQEILTALTETRPDLLSSHPVLISIMAGTTTATLEQALRPAMTSAPAVIRAMPNTPAAIGHGMTGLFAGPGVTQEQKDLADALLGAAGATVWTETEDQINVLTAISGSGPAYVFLLAELLEKAAIAQGLPAATARLLARKTISGAGALLDASPEDAAQLRVNVTSPGGTTAAALQILSAPDNWPASVSAAVEAAIRRARELAA